MERYKKKVEDKDGFKNHVMQNALGNPIILKKTPTSPSDLKGNTIGVKDNKLYLRLANGKLFSATLTEIT